MMLINYGLGLNPYIHPLLLYKQLKCITQFNTSFQILEIGFHMQLFKLSKCIDLGPLHTRDWEPVTSTLQALSLVEKAEPVQVRFTLRLRDQRSMWMQDGCKVYMDSYMASNRWCFIQVTWTIFKNHLLEVGLTQNQETMALRTLKTIALFYFIMCEDPHE